MDTGELSRTLGIPADLLNVQAKETPAVTSSLKLGFGPVGLNFGF